MEAFWKAAAVAVLTMILRVTLDKTAKDISVVLSIVACCAVIMVALNYLSEVIEFLWKIGNSSDYRNPFMNILLKISGAALATEVTGLICADAGNSSLSKALQILGSAAILFLSLPVFESFLSVIQEISGFLS